MKNFKQALKATFLSISSMMLLTTTQAQVVKPFTPRSPEGTSTTVHKLKGDFEIIGNSNMNAQSSTADDNNNTVMDYVDVDNDNTTVNSSSATLVYTNENGADHINTTVAYAGLYWTGRAHQDNYSPHTATVGANTSIKEDDDNFFTYNLVIASSDDNSSNTTGSERRVATYTFLPLGTGDTVVFKYYTWKTGWDYHHKLTVKDGSQALTNLTIENSPSSSSNVDVELSTPYGIGSGSNAFFVTELGKRRTNNSINSKFYAKISNGGQVLDKHVVKFKKAGDVYQTITADTNEIYYPTSDHGLMYSAYADVTNYVQQHGAGEYTLANLMIIEGDGGSTGYYGGWSLVVIYANPAMNSRNITVFDGHAYVPGNVTASHEITISGFETVPVGQVNVKIGYMAGEGDKSINGDYLQIQKQSNSNWVSLTHGSNTTNNFFNSTITTNGVRTPSLSNNFGIDIGVVQLNNTNNELIPNSATTAKFRYGTSQDTYVIPLFVFGIDAFSTKGRVVDDANAMTDAQVNSSGSQTLPLLYAHIFSNNQVVRVELVDPNTGNFEMAGLGNGNYEVRISEVSNPLNTTTANFVQTIPSGWVLTGESTTGGPTDGIIDGKVTFTMSNGDVTGLLFGIERLPYAHDNPGNPGSIDYAGAAYYTVDSSTFLSNDFDGHVTSVLLVGLPANIDSMKVNGITYDANTFPASGILVPTNAFGYPTQLIELYVTQPLVGQTIIIPFHVYDNGTFQSIDLGNAYVLISSILPVEMVSFDAYKKGSTNVLDWVTHVEVNNKGFHIERSEDAMRFEKIGFVIAASAEELVNNYQFVDEKPFSVTYYRLKQEDIDGRYTYSEIRRVDQSIVQNNVTVYPNPTRDLIHIKQDRMAEKEAVLVNIAGQIVQVVALEEAVTTLKLSHLPRGIYYLSVGEETIRILLN